MLSPLQREFYQENPAIWMKDRLDLRLETIDWRLIPEFTDKGYVDEDGNIVAEKWDGTPNPIFELLKGLTTHRRIGVESATGTGKTFIAAAIVLWFLDCFGVPDDPNNECIVVTVAPKEDQLKKLLWKEIHRLWPKFQKHHPEAEILTTEIRMRPDRKNWVAIGWSVGTGAEEAAAVRAQGFHGEHMLWITDETPGIANSVLESAIGTSTAPHNIILSLGNPDHVDDSLHQLCIRDVTKDIRMSAYDHPNVVSGNGVFIPGAVSQESIDERLDRYKTKDHPLYLSRVRGICPDIADKCLFRPDALAAAKNFLKTPIKTFKCPHRPEAEEGQPAKRTLFRRSEGEIRIYSEAVDTHLNRYLLFADVAGDAGRGDWHACIVFDRVLMKPAAFIHMRGPREEYIEAILMVADMYTVDWRGMEGKFYPMFAWEKTGGAGSFILDDRVKVYPNLYQSRNPDVIDGNIRSAIGWDTTSKTRRTMVNELDEFGLMLYEKPHLVVDPTLYDEMTTFVWKTQGRGGRYEHAKGKYDDCVMALGGALTIHKLLPMPKPQEPEKTPQTSDRKTPYERLRERQRNDADMWTASSLPPATF